MSLPFIVDAPADFMKDEKLPVPVNGTTESEEPTSEQSQYGSPYSWLQLLWQVHGSFPHSAHRLSGQVQTFCLQFGHREHTHSSWPQSSHVDGGGGQTHGFFPHSEQSEPQIQFSRLHRGHLSSQVHSDFLFPHFEQRSHSHSFL